MTDLQTAVPGPEATVRIQTPDRDYVDGTVVDKRPRWRRLMAPLSLLFGVTLATMYVRQVDPNEPGHYPMCPTKMLAGIDCPGCGGLRATHDLAHGNVAGALDHNALWVVLVPVVVFFMLRAVYYAWRGTRPVPEKNKASRASAIALLVLVAVFTIVRNLGFGSYFAAG